MFHARHEYYNMLRGTFNSYSSMGGYYAEDYPFHRSLKNEGIKRLNKEEFRKLIEGIESDTTQTILNLQKRYIDNKQFVEIMKTLSNSKRSHISQLFLSENLIDDEGIKEIMPLLKTNNRLIIIDLSCNLIGEKGIQCFLEVFKTNITITELTLLKNPISNGTLLQLKKLMSRNVEIQKEVNQFIYYIALAIISRIANFPREITYLLLDYYNEALVPEVRNHIREILYPKAMKIARNLKSEMEKEIREKIFSQESKLEDEISIHRIIEIQKQYETSQSNSSKFQSSLEDRSSDFTALLFSNLNNIQHKQSLKHIQLSNNFERKHSINCNSRNCCNII